LATKGLKYTEEELVSGLKNSDKAAFAYLFDQYSDALYGVVFKIIPDDDWAQDILQEAFVKIWKNIPNYDPSKGRLFTWLLNIVRNHSIDTLRSKQFKQVSENHNLEDSVNIIDSERNQAPKEDTIGIVKLLDHLIPDQKILVELIYLQGYTQQEAADELKIPLGTVKTRLRNALLNLRNKIN